MSNFKSLGSNMILAVFLRTTTAQASQFSLWAGPPNMPLGSKKWQQNGGHHESDLDHAPLSNTCSCHTQNSVGTCCILRSTLFDRDP